MKTKITRRGKINVSFSLLSRRSHGFTIGLAHRATEGLGDFVVVAVLFVVEVETIVEAVLVVGDDRRFVRVFKSRR